MERDCFWCRAWNFSTYCICTVDNVGPGPKIHFVLYINFYLHICICTNVGPSLSPSSDLSMTHLTLILNSVHTHVQCTFLCKQLKHLILLKWKLTLESLNLSKEIHCTCTCTHEPFPPKKKLFYNVQCTTCICTFTCTMYLNILI